LLTSQQDNPEIRDFLDIEGCLVYNGIVQADGRPDMLSTLLGCQMSNIAIRGAPLAKKKTEPSESKRYGTLIRVSDKFAEAVRGGAQMERLSMAEFIDTHFLAAAQKRHKDAVLKEARRMEGS
jgi:hypothetical protein